MDDFRCLAASVETHWFRAGDPGRHTGFLAPAPLSWPGVEDGQADRQEERSQHAAAQGSSTARQSMSSAAARQSKAQGVLTHSSHLSYLALIPDAQNNKTPASRSEGAHARYRITYPGFGLLDTAQQGL
ncbi:hypothetical protein C8034_v010611 [Colletotrichum sidae]|uniref:Uncharacterized protein n=1 Tax=Colletotrichum sidae TaxID=1347389 RepID=A0A4R8T1K0_9PEZI|nr:hypothetical protein C8034_v010611 [Colletotrichum sidae]